MTRAVAVLVSAAAVVLTGCQDPYADNGSRPQPAHTPAAAGKPPASNADPSAREVARSFAMRWINWDWRTAADQERGLAQLATPELARTLRANAASARIDATVARDKPGSRGTVAAAALTTTGSVSEGLVVTHEQTFTAGHADLGGRRYRVYLVALALEHRTWGVSRWAPQP